MNTYTLPITTCTHWSCVCVYFGGGRCVSVSVPQQRNGRVSGAAGGLAVGGGRRRRRLPLCCCFVCIHYNYIHTYIRETNVVCNRSVHGSNTRGAAA